MKNLSLMKPVFGWEGRYLISKGGDIVQLRQKSVSGLDLKGRYLYLDNGGEVAKVYLHDILISTYGKSEVNETQAIVEFLTDIDDRMLKKCTFEVVENVVEVTFPIILKSVKKVKHVMKLYLLDDAKAIFNIAGKYGSQFLKY